MRSKCSIDRNLDSLRFNFYYDTTIFVGFRFDRNFVMTKECGASLGEARWVPLWEERHFGVGDRDRLRNISMINGNGGKKKVNLFLRSQFF